MGKFSGYLICSDFDGTMAQSAVVIEKNIDAIRYFQENGGYFTVCTGRSPEFMKRYLEQFAPNTYTIGTGGAQVANIQTGEVLYSHEYTAHHKALCHNAVRVADDLRFLFLHQANNETLSQIKKEDFLQRPDEYLNHRITKAVFVFNTPESAVSFSEQLREQFRNEEVEIVRSWPTGVELIPYENSKRTASHTLKTTLGAHTLICVGDYENDISMVQGADIGYAVENAIDSLKAVADRITVAVEEGAIWAIVEDIERSLDNF